MFRTRGPVRPSLEIAAPDAVLELLYGRAALGLHVLPEIPAICAPPVPLPAADGAELRWMQYLRATIDHLVLPRVGHVPTWLTGADAQGIDRVAAQAWVDRGRDDLRRWIAPADPVATALAARRRAALHRHRRSLVLLLPLDGHHWQALGDDVVVLSLATYLDDRHWRRALRGLRRAV